MRLLAMIIVVVADVTATADVAVIWFIYSIHPFSTIKGQ